MTPFQRHLKEALHLNENVPEIKPIQSDPDGNPIYPSGFGVFNPGGRETVAPPGGGDLDPSARPGGFLQPDGTWGPKLPTGPPPWYYELEDGTVMIDPEGTGEWIPIEDLENPGQDSDDETEDGRGRDELEDETSDPEQEWKEQTQQWYEDLEDWNEQGLLWFFENGDGLGIEVEQDDGTFEYFDLPQFLEWWDDFYQDNNPSPVHPDDVGQWTSPAADDGWIFGSLGSQIKP